MSDEVKDAVKKRYGSIAALVQSGSSSASCCGGGSECGDRDPITRDLYDPAQAGAIPGAALAASMGCGNPTALLELRPGETVLDLGSGGGIDVLLSAQRVGPSGKVFGLDMTTEMLELARRNQREAGATNVEFLLGSIEAIPLPDESVDVVISNCVINLSTDKARTLAEAIRVLRPGGRFAVSDVVLRRELTGSAKASMELWTGCIAGALIEGEYRDALKLAGFVDVSIEPTRVFDKADSAKLAADAGGCCGSTEADALDGAVMSAFIRATKP
ncbi:MAG: arsenite methyltransferase [Planctomycetes bacterium]|nr:arsenite methyltransferase [Planctomycetota bacterium]